MMKKQTDGQLELASYSLPEIRLRVRGGDVLYGTEPLNSPSKAVRLLGDKILSGLDREYVVAVNLNTKLQPINFSVVGIGGVDAAEVHIPNIFKAALAAGNTSSIILLHNHPSGSAAPSREDIVVTQRVFEAGRILGIPLTDHIIIGSTPDEQYSFRENHQEIFTEQYELGRKNGVGERTEAYSPETQYPSRAERVKELTDKLETGVREVFESERYKNFLDTMAKFYHYSIGNQILIAMQRPDASLVASYTDWQRKFGRQVQKGEKGIQILAPAPYRKTISVTDQETGDQEVKEVIIQAFKPVSVFDVSQTQGEPIPSIGVDELTGDVHDYEDLMESIRRVAAPVPIELEEINTGAKGYYDPVANRIAIRDGMSQEQTIKTALHELVHSVLHNPQRMELKQKDSTTKEVEAESTAFVLANMLHVGTDIGDYSFPYVASWSSTKETQELKESLRTIRDTAVDLSDRIQQQLLEIKRQRTLDMTAEASRERGFEISHNQGISL